MGVVWVLWGGLRASCAPYSQPHFYTYWLTSYLADSLQNVGHHANRVEQGSTLCSSSFDALIKVYSAYRARHDDIRTIDYFEITHLQNKARGP